MAARRRQERLFDLPAGPHLALELEAGGVVAGVDEAGRGPWAGPVVAAAVILDHACIPDGIDDSKRLSRRRRALLRDAVMECAVVGIGQASVEEVDELNILGATLAAMARAVAALPERPGLVLIDGLHAPPALDCASKCVVRGDRISLSIAAASIIAKVTRDGIMTALARDHPHYGWERNAGYGTPEHRDALNLVGVSPIHRKSFAPIRKLMTQESAITN